METKRHLILAALVAIAIGCSKGDEGDEGGDTSGGEASAPLDKDKLAEIAAVEIAGFEASPGKARKTRVMSIYTSEEKLESGKRVKVTARVEACQPGCVPMDPEEFKKITKLDSRVKNDPELVWEIEKTELPGGKTGLSQYILAHTGNIKTNSYTLRHNDGVNALQVTTGCSPSSSAPDEEGLKKDCPPDKQLEAAKKVFGALAKHL